MFLLGCKADLCFNPCFDGSVARGGQQVHCEFAPYGFNPCFDGSVARGDQSPLSVATARIMFQSLF